MAMSMKKKKNMYKNNYINYTLLARFLDFISVCSLSDKKAIYQIICIECN